MIPDTIKVNKKDIGKYASEEIHHINFPKGKTDYMLTIYSKKGSIVSEEMIDLCVNTYYDKDLEKIAIQN